MIRVCSNKNKLKTFVFVFSLTLISFLLYYRDIRGGEISKFVFFIIIVLYGLYADYIHLMYLTMFILPLTNGLPSNYIIPIICILLFLKGRKKIVLSPFAMGSWFVICIIELLHFLSSSIVFNWPIYIGYCSSLFLLFFIASSDDSVMDNSKCALFFCVGTCVMLTLISMNYNNLIGDDFMSQGVRVGGDEVEEFKDKMTLKTNANYIGLYSISSLSISLVLLYYKKINALLFAVIFAISLVFGSLSVSRTWLLCLPILFVCFLLFRKQLSFNSIFIPIILIVLIGVLFIGNNTQVIDSFTFRFESSNLRTGGGRSDIMRDYNNYLISHPGSLLFGCGAITLSGVTHLTSPHNGLQQILGAYGIPGLVLFLYLFVRSIKKWYCHGQKMMLIPVILVVLFLQSIQFLVPMYCMYSLMGAYFILKSVAQDKSNGSQLTINN